MTPLTYADCTYGVSGSYEHLCAMTYGDCLYGSPGGVFHNLCGTGVATTPSPTGARWIPDAWPPPPPDDIDEDALIALALALA